eukprot:4377544-Pleurochrysis_carterae.AAC.1
MHETSAFRFTEAERIGLRVYTPRGQIVGSKLKKRHDCSWLCRVARTRYQISSDIRSLLQAESRAFLRVLVETVPLRASWIVLFAFVRGWLGGRWYVSVMIVTVGLYACALKVCFVSTSLKISRPSNFKTVFCDDLLLRLPRFNSLIMLCQYVLLQRDDLVKVCFTSNHF